MSKSTGNLRMVLTGHFSRLLVSVSDSYNLVCRVFNLRIELVLVC